MKRFIRDWIDTTFSSDEQKNIPKSILDKEIDLQAVENTLVFINQCKEESLLHDSAGSHNIDKWEKGWSGDGVFEGKGELANLPYYFKKNEFVRLNDQVYRDISGFSEVFLLRCLQSISIKKILSHLESSEDQLSLIEFGCGTGHNLTFISQNFNFLKLYGTDWARSSCQRIQNLGIVSEGNSWVLDYFKSDTFKFPKEKFIAFTTASLEQTGKEYDDFYSSILQEPNCIAAVHIEPMRELLNISTPLNKAAFDYAKQRNYLNDLTGFVKSQENIEIKECKDFGIGSKFISGYQVLSWTKV